MDRISRVKSMGRRQGPTEYTSLEKEESVGIADVYFAFDEIDGKYGFFWWPAE
jgi:hypothetical protein